MEQCARLHASEGRAVVGIRAARDDHYLIDLFLLWAEHCLNKIVVEKQNRVFNAKAFVSRHFKDVVKQAQMWTMMPMPCPDAVCFHDPSWCKVERWYHPVMLRLPWNESLRKITWGENGDKLEGVFAQRCRELFLLGYIDLDPQAVLVFGLLLYLTPYSGKAKAACIEIASKCRKEAETRAATNESSWMCDPKLLTKMITERFDLCMKDSGVMHVV